MKLPTLPRRQVCDGVTLIELLIVIAIIGLLVQLILPAIEASREAARRTQCVNNLRQIGLAAQNHESMHGFLPTAGWGYGWIGDPNRGSGRSQPGSWAYQLLPYLEASSIHDMGLGQNGADLRQSLATMAGTPYPLLYCPSRRLAKPTENHSPPAAGLSPDGDELFWYHAARPQTLARMDYSASMGDQWMYWGSGPSPEDAESDLGFLKLFFEEKEFTLDDATGVVIQREPFRLRQITDGLSNTYFAGEKFLWDHEYKSGRGPRDDQSCWNGDDLDTVSSAGLEPQRDGVTGGAGGPRTERFGAVHPDGVNMVFCDGSVQSVSYDVDPEVHRRYGNRKDDEIARQTR